LRDGLGGIVKWYGTGIDIAAERPSIPAPN
jgi:hypothetical protein